MKYRFKLHHVLAWTVAACGPAMGQVAADAARAGTASARLVTPDAVYVMTEQAGAEGVLEREYRRGSEWTFMPVDGGTRVEWTYTFHAHNAMTALPLSGMTQWLWRGYMDTCLENTRRLMSR